MTDVIDWIRLTRTGASSRRLNRLIDHFGDPAALFGAGPAEVSAACRCDAQTARRILDPAHIPPPNELERLNSFGVRVVSRFDEAYPEPLRGIPDPPPVLYIRGDAEYRTGRAIAIVGTRRCTEYGKRTARRLASELAAAGVTIVSGLARGIDTEAHLAALNAGGRTFACLGSGLNVCYPPENASLADRVAGSGALFSEYPLDSQPDAWHFPSRNRIISGLSDAVVVVEAPAGSGSLLTADAAIEHGREVFAVPGSVESSRSRGPHLLIKQGALLAESAEDILRDLGWLSPQKTLEFPDAAPEPAPPPDLPPSEAKLLLLLDHEAKPVDDLIQESELPAAVVGAAMVTLELKGLARRLPGNCYIRLVR